jgi:hypothetical protein
MMARGETSSGKVIKDTTFNRSSNEFKRSKAKIVKGATSNISSAEFKRTEVYPRAVDMKLSQQYPHRVILQEKGVPSQRYRNLMMRDGVLPERRWSRER